MKKREIKLIAMDMDGTLLTSSKEITEHTIEVLEAAMDRGDSDCPCNRTVSERASEKADGS